MNNLNNRSDSPRLSFRKHFALNFLRFFFKLLYHQFAWTYDLVAAIVSLGAWQSWITSVMPYLDGPRILEIGFGPGHLLAALSQKGFEIIGIDESIQMAQIAHRRLVRSGLGTNLIRGDARTLPFVDQCFHQVVTTFPSENIFTPASLLEIHRILVSDGELIVLLMAWITGQKPMERAAAWINHVSGEAPEWDEKFLEPLKNLGFMITWETIEFENSHVLMIRMLKSST